MMLGKGAILLVLVCAIVFLDPVVGKYPTCTATQKKDILKKCRRFIKHIEGSVLIGGPCCKAVRMVPNRNMLCVIALLSDSEKRYFSQVTIMKLQELCKLSPRRPIRTKFMM
ncbi:unnamed protein product [Urochloa decumbens]|uniref:Bifunctional inhibitor/plant lipid transfer protein/seed storage helical domain-containing protein n=1 Tax=Urochloa decumbens TaxID=240449 RepID=A0ABC9AV79_9POAL